MKKILPCLYRSQRDNADRPGSSCNTTAMVMVLEASGHPTIEIVGLPNNKQPEDYLTEIGSSQAAYAKMQVLCPWFLGPEDRGLPFVLIPPVPPATEPTKLYAAVRPPEAPTMLDWIVEQAYKKAITRYDGGVTFGVMLDQIDRGRAVLLHGAFTPAGHYVALVGYEAVDDLEGKVGQMTGLICNDPWGRYPDYTDPNGEHVLIPLNTATAVLKPVGGVIKSGNLVVG